MNDITTAVVTIFTGIIGVAILAVLVSQRANTAGVLSAGGSAFANSLSAATGPVTGAATAPNNSIGGSGSGALSMGLGSFGNFALPSFGQ